MPSTALPSSRPHAALIWLIRGAGALLAAIATLTAISYISYMVITAVRNGTGNLGWWGVLAAALVIAVLLGLIAKTGYDMFSKLNGITVTNFSFLFAALVALAWYHSLPTHLSKAMLDYFRSNPFLIPFADSHGVTDRSVVSYLAFFLFYKLIKAYLLQVLDLDPAQSSQKLLSPPSSSLPDGPFVPFDPYNPSQNRPIRPV
jgi:hypothetical protein